MVKGGAKNKKGASQDVRKEATVEKGSPVKDKELDSAALNAASPAKDVKSTPTKDKELNGFADALSAKGSPVKEAKETPAKDKDLDGLCDALDKVEVKEEGGDAKPFKVVDDVEKEEFEKQKKKAKKEVPPSKLPAQVRAPTKNHYKIPREWACYSKCGEVVPTTPFLPFKSPLSEERFKRHPELEEHTIVTLIQYLSERGIRMTTVIDLTLPFFYETDFLEWVIIII
ncbi:hypothetical protein PRIPAC_87789 [Pristionchus pacificus]|uniref:Uncharacterized protein n=1 Tax=Pristionchus pacificus TaxID=54126 RepID=A0A2A6B9A1_PRIPA|nr:hypothetical protein PRIPAC_87789 [Pristionchus pacificus]|eukprot:PDM62460.1 hypothetical protein PRIPAC_51902 [Pristionchus pacificus]